MEAIRFTEKLERLSQKEVVRFFMYMMGAMKLNPQRFEHWVEVESVSINDKGSMTTVEVKLVNKFTGRSFIYTDHHALDYSCSNQSLSPIK